MDFPEELDCHLSCLQNCGPLEMASNLLSPESRNFSHLLIETDSFTAVNLSSKDPIDNHPLSSLVFDCRDLLRCIPHVKISHVMRESNMAADILAKMGHDMTEDFVAFESVSQPLINACIADIVGVEFPRTS
ncbi:hypothetical protein SLEP1_g3385 [Rubroshorea leprosula]|uniref:RNase H type-1 domain-containing protein n=1 Tax=Rubroshorea leprosula TaxID=152421 RepID=A0AAV5HUL0_9ROSI|nr:hypothetical protein SLEP1_g3385 [Rubroshorea leprosula]